MEMVKRYMEPSANWITQLIGTILSKFNFACCSKTTRTVWSKWSWVFARKSDFSLVSDSPRQYWCRVLDRTCFPQQCKNAVKVVMMTYQDATEFIFLYSSVRNIASTTRKLIAVPRHKYVSVSISMLWCERLQKTCFNVVEMQAGVARLERRSAYLRSNVASVI